METSDDASTLAILAGVGVGVAAGPVAGLAVGGAIAGGQSLASSQLKGGAKGGIAKTAARRIGEGGPDDPEKRTAAALPQGTEQARQNRRRRSTSLLTRNFPLPQLSTPGLLG